MKRLLLTVSLFAGLLWGAANCAQATFVSYGASWTFDRITSNHTEDVGPLLHVELGSDPTVSGYAAFRFDFAPGFIATLPEIASIYLEDGAHSGSQLFAAPSDFPTNPFFSNSQSSGGAQFGVGTPSIGLPGAGSLATPFVNRDGFLGTSTGPGNGINPGEHALFFVQLNSGVTLADIVTAITHPVLDGGAGYDLRIGLREVNSGGGLADGYLVHAPEPATIGVWAIGLATFGCVTAWRRKRATT